RGPEGCSPARRNDSGGRADHRGRSPLREAIRRRPRPFYRRSGLGDHERSAERLSRGSRAVRLVQPRAARFVQPVAVGDRAAPAGPAHRVPVGRSVAEPGRAREGSPRFGPVRDQDVRHGAGGGGRDPRRRGSSPPAAARTLVAPVGMGTEPVPRATVQRDRLALPGVREDMIAAHPVIEVTAFGLASGATFGLLALGLVLIYRTTGAMNFSHWAIGLLAVIAYLYL